MTKTLLNIDYWAFLYSATTGYAEQYNEAMNCTSLVDRARNLWEWKGLNRSIAFETIAPVIKRLDRDDYIDEDHDEAIESLSGYLNDEGVVESISLVTSAFLLHLMTSGPDQYSAKFPIYDRRVWNAYVYLWRIRGDGELLYRQASQSPFKYGEFCKKFSQTCPNNKQRDYERALFMFGGFIMDLPPSGSPTPIDTIDKNLKTQEKTITDTQTTSGYALTNINEILGPD